MKKGSPVIIITILSLLAVITMQTAWVFNTYKSVKHNIIDISNEVIIKMIEEEASIIFSSFPQGSTIEVTLSDERVTDIDYRYLVQSLSDLGYSLSLERMDSIAKVLLSENEIDSNFSINRVEVRSNTILESSTTRGLNSLFSISSDIVPTSRDGLQGLQLVLINPFLAFFQRIGLIIIATALLMGLIIWSIIYQIRIINRQNRIARLRQDFTYALIHDMKTPLSTIMASLSFLGNGKMSNLDIKNKFCSIAADEVNHLLSLTNRILTISKLENQKLELHKTNVYLPSIISSLIEKFDAKSIKPIIFTTDFQATEVMADEELLTEAISNLIDNAIKYSKEKVEISITTQDGEGYTLIKVLDHGIGISEKDQRIIFEKFERAAAVKRIHKGSAAGFGLGLNYVYQVSEAHGGHVAVNSIVGQFSEFIIYIPKIMEDYHNDQIIIGRR